MFVSAEDIATFTGYKRPSAQARFLARLGIKFVVRVDGSIALRQEELDQHTLSNSARKADALPEWRHEPNLVFDPPRPCMAEVEVQERIEGQGGVKVERHRRKCKLQAQTGSDYCWTHRRWRSRRE